MEKISVIVPIYNVEKYLRRCIDSIINQSYENLEIILVNDGSLDNSSAVCEEYKKNDNRIIVIHQENKGVSAARNAGIDLHSGKYISFVDSDDWIDRDMIYSLYHNLIKYDADISVCGMRCFDKDANLISSEQLDTNKIVIFSEPLSAFKEDKDYICDVVWNKLYKSHLFADNRFQVGKIFEDTAIMYLLIEQSKNIVYDLTAKYNYQIRGGSITNSFSDEFFSHSEVLINRYKYLSDKYPVLEKKYRKSIFRGYLYIVEKLYRSNVDFKTYKSQISRITDAVKDFNMDDCNLSDSDMKILKLAMGNYKSFITISKYLNQLESAKYLN